MRNPEEWNEDTYADKADQNLTHEHKANTYTWGDNADGSIWQVGTCDTCQAELARKQINGIYTEWIPIP